MASPQVGFEYPPASGQFTSQTEFNQGDTIGLMIKATDWASDTFQVTIAWDNQDASPVLYNGQLSWLGNANIELPLPNVVTKGVLTCVIIDPFQNAKVILNLGVGEPADVNPIPPDASSTLITILKWVAIGAGVVGVAYLASKAAPSIAEGVAKSRAASRR